MRSEEEIRQRVKTLLDEANSLLPQNRRLDEVSGAALYETCNSMANDSFNMRIDPLFYDCYAEIMQNKMAYVNSLIDRATELQWTLGEK